MLDENIDKAARQFMEAIGKITGSKKVMVSWGYLEGDDSEQEEGHGVQLSDDLEIDDGGYLLMVGSNNVLHHFIHKDMPPDGHDPNCPHTII